MSEIASAFVRIRPNMAGFKGEVEHGVRDSVKDVGKIIGGALAATGAFEIGKNIVERAAAHQAAFAGLEKSTKDAHASTTLFGKSLEQLLEQEARLKGFSDEQLAQSFLRLVTVTHSSAKAFVELQDAEDLSRARKIDLEQAALAVSKVTQGQANSLQRYGIVIPHVTAAEEALTTARRRAVAAGATFSAAQNAVYQESLKAAKAQDRQATSTQALATIQQRFGGNAETFANTASGQFARLQQDFHQFEVAIGTALLPTLAGAAEGLGNFVGALAHNEEFARQVRQTVGQLADAFHELESAAKTIGPPLLTVTRDLGGVVRILELATAIAVGRKVIGYLAELAPAGAAVAAEDAAMASAETGLTAALTANTAAIYANVAALDAQAGSVAADVVILDQFGGELATVTAQETAAAGAADTLAGSAAAGVAKVGLLARGVGLLSKALAEYLIVNQAVKLLPGQHDLGFDFSNGTAADVTGANGSPYPKGSGQDDLYQRGFHRQSDPITHKELFSAKNFDYVHEEQAFQAGLKASVKAGLNVTSLGEDFFGTLANAWKTGVDKFSQDVKSGQGFQHMRSAAAAAIRSLRQGISTDQEDIAALKAEAGLQAQQSADAIAGAITSAKGNVNQIGQTIAQDIAATASRPFELATERINAEGDKLALAFDRQTQRLQANATRIGQQLDEIQLAQQARAARFAGADAAISAQESRLTLNSDRLNVAQLRRSFILPGGRTLSTNDKTALAELERYAAHAKGASRLAIQEFIGQFRAATLSVEKDKISIATQVSPKQAQRQADLGLEQSRNQLRQSVAAARQASAQARLQIRSDIVRIGQDAATARARVTAQEIADLTDSFNRAPSAPALKHVVQRMADIMASNHVTFAKVGKLFGSAWLHGFQGQLTGLSLQGQALLGVKGGPGGGLIPSVVKPLETIQQQQQQADSIARQQRRTQLDESKKQTALLQKIHAKQAADKFINSLNKNPGAQTRRSKDLAGTTG